MNNLYNITLIRLRYFMRWIIMM